MGFSSRFRLVAALLWILMVALVLAVMAPGLSGNFFYDDLPNIVENEAIHIHDLTFSSLHGSITGPEAGPFGRPVSVLSFALTHYLFGLDPFAFKAINLVIHAVNGLLVFWFMTLLLQGLRAPQLSDAARIWLAFWVSAVWLVHPINILPVMLSVQRMTLLSGMFMLLALIAHLKGMARAPATSVGWKWLALGWLVFWPLSVLSKETGLLCPLYVMLISLFSGGRNVPAGIGNARSVIAAGISLLTIGAAMLAYLGPAWLEAAYATRPFTLTERLLTEARVLWFYAAQIVVPDPSAFGLYLDDIPISTGFIHPLSTMPALVGWGAVLFGIVRYRYRFPVACFAAAWFLAAHSLESTFLPLEIAHEYRNYLPSLGLLLGAGYLGASGLQRLRSDHSAATTGLVAVAPLLVLALLTWMRADQLGKPLTGAQIEAARHPQSARANYNAALTLIQYGYGDIGDPIGGQSVRYHLLQAGKADPVFKSSYLALIVWSCSSGRIIEREWVDEFARRLESTPMTPSDGDIPANLLKPWLAMPACQSREDVIRLFMAGAANPSGGRRLQARFLDAASDYELLVQHDLYSARDFMAKAVAMLPWDAGMARKLSGYAEHLSVSKQKK